MYEDKIQMYEEQSKKRKQVFTNKIHEFFYKEKSKITYPNSKQKKAYGDLFYATMQTINKALDLDEKAAQKQYKKNLQEKLNKIAEMKIEFKDTSSYITSILCPTHKNQILKYKNPDGGAWCFDCLPK